MKDFTFAFLLLFSVQTAISQTEWAPVGAKWWVLIQTGFTQEFINEYECTGTLDTLGHACKVVHESSFDGLERDFFYYQEGSKVYCYNAFFEEFVLYFDYSKQAGESYQIIYGQDTVSMNIDSVYFKMFGGETVKVQHGRAINQNVEFSEPYNQIYEGIGTYIGLEPSLPSNLTVEIWHYLACYLKPDGSLSNMNPGLDVDCQALATPVDFVPDKSAIFILSPNPSSGPTTLDYALLPHKVINSTSAEVLVLDSYGRTVRRHRLSTSSGSLTLDDLLPGLYFIMLKSNGQVLHTEKLLRF